MSTPTTPASPPTFPKHDPASPAFWDVRFDAAFTPWDQGGVPLSLVNYVSQSPAPKKVLIPGCGAAHEVRFFAGHGWDVAAIDFSPAAVVRAKQLLGDLAVHVREADFFGKALGRERFDAIYERAFLCALPRHLWTAWAARVAELIAPGGRLFGFFFFDTSEKGPPFGISSSALAALLEKHFDRLEDAQPTDSIGVFADKERWQVWQRRGESSLVGKLVIFRSLRRYHRMHVQSIYYRFSGQRFERVGCTACRGLDVARR